MILKRQGTRSSLFKLRRLFKLQLALSLLAILSASPAALRGVPSSSPGPEKPDAFSEPSCEARRLKRPPPNIVLILVDDLGWSDLASYGSAFYRTPNIDHLAARGMKFTRAYAAAPVCSPSRAALLTGKYPARLHLTDWLPGREDAPGQKLLRPQIRQELPLDEVTLAEALGAAGYATASIGKWHLGGKGFAPEDQGFELNVAGDEHGGPASYFYPFMNREWAMRGLEEGRAGEYLTDRLTTEAESFIERNRERPFFLYLPHYAVHIPLKARPELVSKYRADAARPGQTQTNAIYAAMIESVDQSVGRIVRKLEELSLTDNTLVIFTSDNGGLSVKEGPNTPATSNAPLRDGKGYLYEGGIRVPLIFFWSGKIRPGSRSAVPVSGVDLFPTLLEIAGRMRQRSEMDGVSLSGLLGGRGRLDGLGGRRALYWHYPHYSNQGGKPGSAILEGDYKLIEFLEDNRIELYDLKRDAGEAHDLAASMPAKARALLAKLHDWRERVGAQMMKTNPGYRAASRTEASGRQARNKDNR